MAMREMSEQGQESAQDMTDWFRRSFGSRFSLFGMGGGSQPTPSSASQPASQPSSIFGRYR